MSVISNLLEVENLETLSEDEKLYLMEFFDPQEYGFTLMNVDVQLTSSNTFDTNVFHLWEVGNLNDLYIFKSDNDQERYLLIFWGERQWIQTDNIDTLSNFLEEFPPYEDYIDQLAEDSDDEDPELDNELDNIIRDYTKELAIVYNDLSLEDKYEIAKKADTCFDEPLKKFNFTRKEWVIIFHKKIKTIDTYSDLVCFFNKFEPYIGDNLLNLFMRSYVMEADKLFEHDEESDSESDELVEEYSSSESELDEDVGYSSGEDDIDDEEIV